MNTLKSPNHLQNFTDSFIKTLVGSLPNAVRESRERREATAAAQVPERLMRAQERQRAIRQEATYPVYLSVLAEADQQSRQQAVDAMEQHFDKISGADDAYVAEDQAA